MPKNYADIIKQHQQKVKEFLIKHLTSYKLPNNESKLLVDCVADNCDKNRHQLKGIINLDIGGLFYCYKCGHSLSLYQYCKHYNIHNELANLLSELGNINLTELKDELTNNKTEKVISEPLLSDEELQLKSFRIEKGMLPIGLIKEAKEYAIKRTFNNTELIKDWYCDNLYVYIPLKDNNKVYGYIGRAYIDLPNIPRYNNQIIDKTKILCYNYDNVKNNIGNNEVYLCEGLFDSIAIDYALGAYCSIGLLGKSHYKEIINKMTEDFPSDTNIYICLDSIEKDKNIVKDNLRIAEFISKYFSKVMIIALRNGDPNEIATDYGSIELKNQLLNNKYDMVKYRLFWRF